MLRILKVVIEPPIKKAYLASATLTLRDDDGSEIVISHFTINRNAKGAVYVMTPTHGFKTDLGWSYVHIIDFTPELWRDIQAAIWHAWELHVKREGRKPITPDLYLDRGGEL